MFEEITDRPEIAVERTTEEFVECIDGYMLYLQPIKGKYIYVIRYGTEVKSQGKPMSKTDAENQGMAKLENITC